MRFVLLCLLHADVLMLTLPLKKLSKAQIELLALFERDLPEEEWVELRRLIARHFAEKATAGFDAFAEKRGLSVEETDRWAFEHYRTSAYNERVSAEMDVHRRTLEKIFAHPTPPDVRFSDVVALMEALGSEVEADRSGSRIAFILGKEKIISQR